MSARCERTGMVLLPSRKIEVRKRRDLGRNRPPRAPQVQGASAEDDFKLRTRLLSTSLKTELEMRTYRGVERIAPVVEHLAQRPCHPRPTRLLAIDGVKTLVQEQSRSPSVHIHTLLAPPLETFARARGTHVKYIQCGGPSAPSFSHKNLGS